MEKSAWFWLIGNSWPLQKAQPCGAKFQEMIFISAKNGVDMVVSLLRIRRTGKSRSYLLMWKNTKEGKDEIDAQERSHVFVRLAPPCRSNALSVHGAARWIRRRAIHLLTPSAGSKDGT